MTQLPSRAGVGFKPQHFAEILVDPGAPAFFEIHAENYMGAGGPPHAQLTALRERFALSIHGVGLSIGAPGPLDRYQPESFSEHLAWSSHGGAFLNDLLPLPYTEETLARVASHIAETQDALGRVMLIENPATYVRFASSTIPETEFLAEIVRRTGCGLLLDVNNVHVCAVNHGFDADDYLDSFPIAHAREIHLAGHDQDASPGEPLLIDAHGSTVADPVWRLYERAIARLGPVATLIEWDNNVPEGPVLRAEADRADALIARLRAKAA
jgi:uncharacterized protein (UPF0276 family)